MCDFPPEYVRDHRVFSIPVPNCRFFYFVSIVNMNSLSAVFQLLRDILKVLAILSFDKYEFCGRWVFVG